MCVCFPAYDDRQHTKRQQISSRSWFSSPSSTPSGSAAGNLLNKLGLKSRDVTAARALNATPSSSLVRRRSDGGSPVIERATLTSCSSQVSVTCPNMAALNLENSDSPSVQCSDKGQDTHIQSTEENSGKPASEVHCGIEGQNINESCSTKSLVADYSDTDSDTCQ